jgi:hypothetical protein
MSNFWRDPKFKYRNAEETKKPGYLARRFAKIKKEQADAEKAAFLKSVSTVTPIKKVVKQ